MIKILHIDSGLSYRGGQRQVHLLIKSLQRLDTEQYLACPENTPLKEKSEEYIKEYFALPRSNIMRLLRKRNLRGFIRENNINLIHAHDSHAHSLATLLKNAKPEPAIFVTRRSSGEIGFGSRTKYSGFGINFIAISMHVKENLISGGVPAASIRVISSMIDTDLYGRNRPGMATARPEKIKIVSAGAFDKKKGFSDALAAIEIISQKRNDFLFILYGEGPQKKEFEKIIRTKNLSKFVKMPGWSQSPELFLSEADIYLTPSHKEGLNMSLLEAMASGAAVLASDIPSHRENIIDAETGFLFPVGDINKLAEKLNYLTEDYQLLRRIGSKAADYAARFDCRQISRKIFRYYNEIVVP